MESLLSFFGCIGTMNRSVGTPLVWSPAFRRFGPAKAGIPNGRFMERSLSFFRRHRDPEPTPNPSPPSRRAKAPLRRDGGWDGSGGGWVRGELPVQSLHVRS